MALQAENFGTAKRLAGEYSDDLRLLADLGFGEGSGESVELTAPPEVLCRVLPRLRDLALDYTAGRESERAEARELEERNRLVAEACEAVLADLDAAQEGRKKLRGWDSNPQPFD
jgi:hypothetical protein